MGQVMKQMRKYSAASVAWIVVLCFGAGLAIILFWLGAILQIIGGAKELNGLNSWELSDTLAECEIDYALDCFAEYDDNSGRYYVIPCKEDAYLDSVDYYLAVYVGSNKFDDMDAVCDDTWAYLTGEGENQGRTCFVKGTIRRMDSDERQYFEEWFYEAGMSEEEYQEYAATYVLMDGYYAYFDGEAKLPQIIVMTVIALVIIGIGIFVLIRSLTGGFLKKLKCDLAQYGALGDSRLVMDYENAHVISKKLRVGQIFTYNSKPISPRAYLNSNIVWAYQQRTKNYTNGIYSGSSYQVWLYSVKQSVVDAQISLKKKHCDELLEYYNNHFRHMVVGYTDQLRELYFSNKDEFLSLRYNSAQEQPDDAFRQDETAGWQNEVDQQDNI